MHQLRGVHQALPVFRPYLGKDWKWQEVDLQQGQVRRMRFLRHGMPPGALHLEPVSEEEWVRVPNSFEEWEEMRLEYPGSGEATRRADIRS